MVEEESTPEEEVKKPSEEAEVCDICWITIAEGDKAPIEDLKVCRYCFKQLLFRFYIDNPEYTDRPRLEQLRPYIKAA